MARGRRANDRCESRGRRCVILPLDRSTGSRGRGFASSCRRARRSSRGAHGLELQLGLQPRKRLQLRPWRIRRPRDDARPQRAAQGQRAGRAGVIARPQHSAPAWRTIATPKCDRRLGYDRRDRGRSQAWGDRRSRRRRGQERDHWLEAPPRPADEQQHPPDYPELSHAASAQPRQRPGGEDGASLLGIAGDPVHAGVGRFQRTASVGLLPFVLPEEKPSVSVAPASPRRR
jgi:hypothetical protein